MLKRLKKFFMSTLVIGMAFAGSVALTSCGSNYTCSYCGDTAVWKAQETFLGKAMYDPVYVCAACKRAGYGPKVKMSGDIITWTHL